MQILVVGGADYIGSHMIKMLLEASHAVAALDDSLVSGHRNAVLGGEFVQGDLADTTLLGRFFASTSLMV